MRFWFHRERKRFIRSFEEQVSDVYDLYREAFVVYAINYFGVSREIAIDVYHDSFMEMLNNIRQGRYIQQKASLKTYLFSIGKHLLCKQLRRDKSLPLSAEWLKSTLGDTDWERAMDVVMELVDETDGTVCNRILKLFYWEQASMAEIAELMHYSSSDVAKNKKSSCLRRMAYMVKQRLSAMDIYYKLK